MKTDPNDQTRISGIESSIAIVQSQIAELAKTEERSRAQWKDAFTVISATVTFLVTGAFVWQVTKAAEITSLADTISKENQESQLSRQAQGELAGDIARSIAQLSLGYRDQSRKREGSALRRAEEAVKIFDVHKPEMLIFRNEEQEGATPTDKVRYTRVKALIPATFECLVAAYELKARALYGTWDEETAAKLEEIRLLGEELTKLRPNRWEGYHFQGLALSEEARLPAYKDKKSELLVKAENLFRMAFARDSVSANIDRLNLAEQYFTERQFEKCIAMIDEFRRSENPDSIPAEHELICKIYRFASEYVIDDNPEKLVAIYERLMEATARQRQVIYNFNLGAIKRFVKELDPEKEPKMLKGSTREFKRTLEALIEAGGGRGPAFISKYGLPYSETARQNVVRLNKVKPEEFQIVAP